MNEGFILIHRRLLDWQWYSNKNDRIVWLHCLLSANWKDGYFEGKKIERGSFVTSYDKLAKEIGISVQQLRTSLNHLKSTNEITHETNNQFSIITINKYNDYQLEQQTNQQTINKRLTNEQQTINNNRINNNKSIKEINNIKEKINKKEKYGSFNNVKLTDEEYQKLKDKFNDYESKIENLSSYLAMKGDKYKNHYAVILNWSRKDEKASNVPSWFNKQPEERKRSEEDERELQELIRGY